MQDYSLALALFDYLPVLASALGLGQLARLLGITLPRNKALIYGGAALVISGGLCKASWKLVWVITATDLVWLANLLFILMAPGMLLLAWHCYRATPAWRGQGLLAPAPMPAIAAALATVLAAAAIWLQNPDSRAWFFSLLAIASIANIAISIMLIRYSLALGQRRIAALFLLSIVLIVSLSGLSRISAGSAPLQWLAEVLNLTAHGSFAIAIFWLSAHIPNQFSRVLKGTQQ